MQNGDIAIKNRRVKVDFMSKNNEISISVIRRLPRYYRFLGELLKVGVERISSKELASMLKLTASQIRQDFNCFGEFGQQGYGYNVSKLHHEISKILGFDNVQDVILIGAGNLGKAILSYTDFEARGFRLIGVFDKDPNIIDCCIHGYKILNIDNLELFCAKQHPTAAILCVPKISSEKLVKQLVAHNVKGFWNFSHYDPSFDYPNVVSENVHLSDSLMTFSYKLNHLLSSSK